LLELKIAVDDNTVVEVLWNPATLSPALVNTDAGDDGDAAVDK